MFFILALTLMDAGRKLMEDIWKAENEKEFYQYASYLISSLPSSLSDSILSPFAEREGERGLYVKIRLYKRQEDMVKFLKLVGTKKYLEFARVPSPFFSSLKCFIEFLKTFEKNGYYLGIDEIPLLEDSVPDTVFCRIHIFERKKDTLKEITPSGLAVDAKGELVTGKNLEKLIKSLSHDSRMLTIDISAGHTEYQENKKLFPIIRRWVSLKKLSLPETYYLYYHHCPFDEFPSRELPMGRIYLKAWKKLISEKFVEMQLRWETIEGEMMRGGSIPEAEWEKAYVDFYRKHLGPLASNLFAYLRAGGDLWGEWAPLELYSLLFMFDGEKAMELRRILKERGFEWGRDLASAFNNTIWCEARQYVLKDISEFTGISEDFLDTIWYQPSEEISEEEKSHKIFQDVCIILAEIFRDVLNEKESLEKLRFLIGTVGVDTVLMAYLNRIPCEKIKEYLPVLAGDTLPEYAKVCIEKRAEKCGIEFTPPKKEEKIPAYFFLLSDSARKYLELSNRVLESKRSSEEKIRLCEEYLGKAEKFINRMHACEDSLQWVAWNAPAANKAAHIRKFLEKEKAGIRRKLRKIPVYKEVKFRMEISRIRVPSCYSWEERWSPPYLKKFVDVFGTKKVAKIILESAEKSETPHTFPIFLAFGCVPPDSIRFIERMLKEGLRFADSPKDTFEVYHVFMEMFTRDFLLRVRWFKEKERVLRKMPAYLRNAQKVSPDAYLRARLNSLWLYLYYYYYRVKPTPEVVEERKRVWNTYLARYF
ncbi:hypothetical protein DRQ20_04910 [bacterium]|nr:MAG: hypothetical protein DRQ20_04910 [bacterium]